MNRCKLFTQRMNGWGTVAGTEVTNDKEVGKERQGASGKV